jgi:hypothetical protein
LLTVREDFYMWMETSLKESGNGIGLMDLDSIFIPTEPGMRANGKRIYSMATAKKNVLVLHHIRGRWFQLRRILFVWQEARKREIQLE